MDYKTSWVDSIVISLWILRLEWNNFFVLFIIVEILIHLCLLSLNHVKSNDFKFICMLIIWVQGFLNLIETLLLLYLETFMWLNEYQ